MAKTIMMASEKDHSFDQLQPKRISFGHEEPDLEIGFGPVGIEDFPSLRDLETSNLFSHNFQATKAAKLALQHFDDAKKKQMEALMKSLEAKPRLTFSEFLKETKDRKNKTRAGATKAFASLLAFAQMGAIDMIQDNSGHVFKDILIVKALK